MAKRTGGGGARGQGEIERDTLTRQRHDTGPMTRHDDTTTPKEGDTTRHTTPDATEVLPLAIAAERLGVSLRTVQRRIASGDLEAIEKEGQRFVVVVGQEPSKVVSRQVATDDTPTTRHDTSDATPDATERPCEIERLSQELAREREERTRDREQNREEVGFLRGVIEQQQRDSAELRAALRKALEIAPRQLESRVGDGNELEPYSARTNTPDAPPSPLLASKSQPDPKPRERATQRGEGLRDLRDAILRVFAFKSDR